VEHLQEMQDFMDSLRRDGLLSCNKVFRSYVDKLSFKIPDDFQDAKYIIIMAVYTPLAKANVRYQGKVRSIFIPPNYYEPDYSAEQLEATVSQKIVKGERYRIENVGRHIYRKHLAVRSGLAKYGRNNIAYVEGMGSMISLSAFFTDYDFEDDHWMELQMMDYCKRCRICTEQCPTGSISDKRFLIDIEKCLPLYNEIEGVIPEWIPKAAHTAIVGCMHCQLACPANRNAVKSAVDFGELTEDETAAILGQTVNDDMIRALSEKLRIANTGTVTEVLPVFSRNLKAFLVNEQNPDDRVE
jgi:epoxyqueuosine reductase